MNSNSIVGKQEDYFDDYWRHGIALRNWFVMYGVGFLVLLLQKNMFEIEAGARIRMSRYVLIGIASQICLTFLNKIIHWCAYYGKTKDGSNNVKYLRNIYKFCERVCNWFIIDIIFDVLTIIFYVVALLILFKTL